MDNEIQRLLESQSQTFALLRSWFNEENQPVENTGESTNSPNAKGDILGGISNEK